MHKDKIARLRATAATLAAIAERETTIAGVCGYLLGATYALLEAARYGFLEGNTVTPDYVNELRQVGQALADGSSPARVSGLRTVDSAQQRGESIWLAGFYFNSALHRIAAAADRMDALRRRGRCVVDPTVPLFVQAVYLEVNKLKHERDGLVPKRSVFMNDAVDALEYLATRFSSGPLPVE